MPAYDVFISHAHEDKQDVVIPLIEALKRAHLKVWFDAHELHPGNSLRSKIDEGLAHSYDLVQCTRSPLQVVKAVA